jgi:hypothetical protein
MNPYAEEVTRKAQRARQEGLRCFLAKPETKLMISLIPPGNPQEVLNTLIESAYNDAFDMGCAAVATSLMDAMVQKLAEGK